MQRENFLAIAENCFYFVFPCETLFHLNHIKALKTYKTHINLDFFMGFNRGRKRKYKTEKENFKEVERKRNFSAKFFYIESCTSYTSLAF